MGLNMNEKKAVIREYRARYRQAGGKEKTRLLDEITSLTGYHRKQAIRVLNRKPPQETVVCTGGQPVKLKPEKKRRPANRTGKRVYGDEVIAALRLIRAFFRYKCGKLLAPLMLQQMDAIDSWPAFGITPAVREKLMTISPGTIDRPLKKDRDALRLKGKSLSKPKDPLKSRIPIRTFYSPEARKTPGFIQVDTVHHCGQAGFSCIPSSTRPIAGLLTPSRMFTVHSPSR